MTGVRKFARVKVPPNVPRFVELPDGERFVPLEEVIAAHLDQLFPGMDLLSHHFFRVTRDADVEVEEDEADDLLAAIETVLQRRQRGATAIRLEIDATMSVETRQVLMRELAIDETQVYVADGLLALADLWFFVGSGSSCAQGRALDAGRSTRPVRGRRIAGCVRSDPARRHPRPPPLRIVLLLGRSVREPGLAGSGRPGDQADALPHIGR